MTEQWLGQHHRRPRVWIVEGWTDHGDQYPKVRASRYTYLADEAVLDVSSKHSGIALWTVREGPGLRRHRPIWEEVKP